MHSAVADTLERREWRHVSGSVLAHHGACCDRARTWMIAMGRSYDFSCTDGLAFAGPRWQEAVIKPEEKHMLAQVFCDHYETIDEHILSLHAAQPNAVGAAIQTSGGGRTV